MHLTLEADLDGMLDDGLYGCEACTTGNEHDGLV
jgi:hypothetical protein